ncbi:MAG: hypothetical protein D6714_19230 [Bacteroidetes bacterium]|nr:MAG: hypothetical protein D6714_19230 [Bacteroidota bacterium]
MPSECAFCRKKATFPCHKMYDIFKKRVVWHFTFVPVIDSRKTIKYPLKILATNGSLPNKVFPT